MQTTINDCLLLLSPDTGLNASENKTIQDDLAKVGIALSSFETWNASTRDETRRVVDKVYWTLFDKFPGNNWEFRAAEDLANRLSNELESLPSTTMTAAAT